MSKHSILSFFVSVFLAFASYFVMFTGFTLLVTALACSSIVAFSISLVVNKKEIINGYKKKEQLYRQEKSTDKAIWGTKPDFSAIGIACAGLLLILAIVGLSFSYDISTGYIPTGKTQVLFQFLGAQKLTFITNFICIVGLIKSADIIYATLQIKKFLKINGSFGSIAAF